MLDRDCVTADSKGPGNVLAGVVGRGRKVAAAFHIRNRDSGLEDQGAARVFNRAYNAAGVFLRPRGGGKS